MRPFGASLAVLAALALPAFAAGWPSYDNTFPMLPCQDGWAGCLVDGAAAGPGALKDAAGRPLPADARFGWFDLKPTVALSPFASLSSYSGPVGGAAAAPPPVEAPPVAAAEPAADARPVADDVQAVADSRPSGGAATSSSVPPTSSATPSPTPTASVTATAPAGGMRPGAPSAVATTSTTSAPAGGMRPGAPSAATTTTTAVPASLPATPTTTSSVPATTPTNAAVAPVSGGQDDSCTDLVKLEPSAMMGQLRTGQTKCLDARIGTEPQQTTKDKVSRLLIANAENKGDKSEWERLIKRHLEDIDRSDPDLCFKYALHLSRGGVGRAQGVIRWADYALENKSKWSGTTYKQRVFNLYKLRAEAANKLWQDAEKEFAEGERTDEKEAKATKFRGQAKDYAREWLDYAKASEQDTKTAMALCVSSSGNRAFCEGG